MIQDRDTNFLYLAGAVILFLLFGSDGKNDDFKPQNDLMSRDRFT